MALHSDEVSFRHAEPVIQNDIIVEGQPSSSAEAPSKTQYPQPLELKGVLNQFKSFDIAPVIGKELTEANLAKWLRAPNSDELLRDLAIDSS